MKKLPPHIRKNLAAEIRRLPIELLRHECGTLARARCREEIFWINSATRPALESYLASPGLGFCVVCLAAVPIALFSARKGCCERHTPDMPCEY